MVVRHHMRMHVAHGLPWPLLECLPIMRVKHCYGALSSGTGKIQLEMFMH